MQLVAISMSPMTLKKLQDMGKVAAETLRLMSSLPAFEQLRRKRNRRKPVPHELIPGLRRV